MMAPQSTTGAKPAADKPTVRIRDADGEADAWYLQRQQHHWFGTAYQSQTHLSLDLFDIAGWTPGDDADGAPIEWTPAEVYEAREHGVDKITRADGEEWWS